MTCIYNYNGHIFSSELALDSFLLEKGKYVSKYGDIVFSSTAKTLQFHQAEIIEEIHKKSNEDNEAAKAWRRAHRSYGPDGELSIDEKPYLGVNTFLASIGNIDGEQRLFPEFRQKSYWENRMKDWKKNQFNDVEKEILKEKFGIDPNTLNESNILDKEYIGTGICDEKNPKLNAGKLQLAIMEKWKVQGEAGTNLHKIAEIYFSKDDSGKYIFEYPDVKAEILNRLPKTIKFSEGIINIMLSQVKKIHNKLKHDFGDQLIFFPEFLISGDATRPNDGSVQKLIGVIDLLIVDNKGRVHILDYKTSIHDYTEFRTEKIAAYQYQLATYQRMLEKQGLNLRGGRLMIAPIKLDGFRLEGDQYIFDSVSSEMPYDDISNNITQKQQNNIDDMMPSPFNLYFTPDQLHEEVSKIMEKWFPDNTLNNEISRESLIKWLKKRNLLKKNENGQYVFQLQKNKSPITATEESEFVDKVLEEKRKQIPQRIQQMHLIKHSIVQAQIEGIDNVDWTTLKQSGESITWLQDLMRKYCNSCWEVQDNDTFEKYGIITIKNKYTKQIDFVRISTSDLYYNHMNKYNNRTKLVGNFEADVVEDSNSNSLMLDAINGNIELMEMMAILNCTDGLEDVKIGNLLVLNPFDGDSIMTTNDELLYSFNALNKHESMAQNKFKDGKLKMMSKFEQVSAMFQDIMTRAELNEFKDNYKPFKRLKNCTSLMDQAVWDAATVKEKETELLKILNLLKGDSNSLSAKKLKRTYTKSNELSDDFTMLTNAIYITLANLKGINFRQHLSDHSKWCDKAIRKGISGTYTDNPGNLSSQTLNLVTKLVTEAYQNTRDEMQKSNLEIRKHVDEYKKHKGMGYWQENLGANQANLYKGLIETINVGDNRKDLMFKNINSCVDESERKFLRFVLETINRKRWNWSEEELQQRIDNYDPECYRVPLTKGKLDSKVSEKGLLKLLKLKLSSWNPKVIFQKMRQKAEGIFNAESDRNSDVAREEIFEMSNMFDGSNDIDKRLRYLNEENGIEEIERNLEVLLLKHDFAYIQQKHINKVFPLIKAALIHIGEQGVAQNTIFTNDRQYLVDYIRNKILNQSIVSKDFEEVSVVTGMIKKAASLFTLALSPVQAIYQPLQGLWTDIRLMIQKPDGKNAFTFQHFKNSLKLVYGELLNFSGNPTLCSRLNELYGLNDMDMNVYAERLSKGRKGIFYNFDNFMFKCASRPDYYNRMSIFLSQMQGDGTLEAHEIIDGKLVYDWKKDKRFEAFANGRTSDPEYNKQKQLYYTIAKQFVEEHTLNEDGTEFELDMSNPKPLPRAYTNREAESMKSLADDIYGYYSHEKKSLIMSTAIGSMWLQFKTYWSGKKNQYLQPGGVRLRGEWQQVSERNSDGSVKLDSNGNEIKYYYQVDSNGDIQYDKPPVTTPTPAPMMQWKGHWQEGIFVTMGNLAHNILQDPKNFTKHIQQVWNNSDENLRRCYRSNLKQFGYDLIMFAIVGSIIGALLADWLKDLKEENKANDDFATGCMLAAANVAVSSIKNSFLDLNFIDSIGSPIGSWTPFSLEWVARQSKNIYKTATGDEDIWDGVLNVASVNKQIRPIFDSVKPEMFRTKKEGGTWESSTTKKNREKREGN